MPSNWQSIDNNFPSFTGEESPQQQIQMLHNYLFQLREGLKYSLQNLTTDNFNTTALQGLTDAQKEMVAQQLISVQMALNQLSVRIDRISAQIGGVTKEWVDGLERRVKELEEDTTASDMEESISGEGGLQDRMNDAEAEIESLTEIAADHEERLQAMENDKTLAETAKDHEKRLKALEEDESLGELQELITGEGGLQSQLTAAIEDLQKITEVIQSGEDGSATIGKEGAALRLVGEIYINGVLFEQGGDSA